MSPTKMSMFDDGNLGVVLPAKLTANVRGPVWTSVDVGGHGGGGIPTV